MKGRDVKEGIKVIDRGYPEMGTGLVTETLKTVFKVDFNGDIHTYDYPHAKFLNVIEEDEKLNR